MSIRFHFACVLTGLLVVGGVNAGDKNVDEQLDKKEIQQDKRELVSTSTTVKELSHAINLWHDANLKGDRAKIRKYEDKLYNIMRDDIGSTATVVKRYETEASRSAREFERGDRNWSERTDDHVDLRDDRRDLQKAMGLLKTKQRLVSSFVKSPAFSSKYRLLGDYVDILRQEQGLTRIELAEDVSEFREDR
ncbi:MAG: hypothetical protein KAW91_00020 [candidate division Zixibacteria bacterium]|nr:hypothetical protein [candidate division Zixibacteria bacterium]